jgi:hypothetical protein
VNGREKVGCLAAGLAWIVFALVFALVLNAFVTAGDCNSTIAAQEAACESARTRNYVIAFLIDAALLAGIFYAFLRKSTRD